jgi:2-iminobutanoate/2-iminopropanoate deaminase
MDRNPERWAPTPLAPGVPTPAGAYSPAVRIGDLIFVSGQVPIDPATGRVVAGDVRVQTARVLENLRMVLAGAGASLADVVSVTAYLADIGDWSAFDAAYRAAFRAPFPTRTTVGAELKGFLVEISAIAAAPRGHPAGR